MEAEENKNNAISIVSENENRRLEDYLTRFRLSVRKKSGEEYESTTLRIHCFGNATWLCICVIKFGTFLCLPQVETIKMWVIIFKASSIERNYYVELRKRFPKSLSKPARSARASVSIVVLTVNAHAFIFSA